MLVAEADGGEIAGFIIGRFQPGFPAGQPLEAEIYNIGVLEQFRVAGIGTKLFNEYVRRCRDAGVAAVWLEVRASNAPAIAFYKKNGFERHSVRPNFYADPAEDAVVMTAAI